MSSLDATSFPDFFMVLATGLLASIFIWHVHGINWTRYCSFMQIADEFDWDKITDEGVPLIYRKQDKLLFPMLGFLIAFGLTLDESVYAFAICSLCILLFFSYSFYRTNKTYKLLADQRRQSTPNDTTGA